MIFIESEFYSRAGWSRCIEFYIDKEDVDKDMTYRKLFDDVKKWCETNLNEDDYYLDENCNSIEFKRAEDATVFLLKYS